ncbi:hypothetical protein ANN_02085 [Periplaneta americana]|uniref:Uncharacterized protein n=1 Tax=Periplaneta americana TaxID=6978 RepID=A0ABQ8TVA8_PERAM|nr:hypothetical protein ANN_02085 [Periplaneta americana]
MAALCEGGNDPPGSLKAKHIYSLTLHYERTLTGNKRRQDQQRPVLKMTQNRSKHVNKTTNPHHRATHPHPYHRQLHIAEPKSAVVQETLKTTTNSVETGSLSKLGLATGRGEESPAVVEGGTCPFMLGVVHTADTPLSESSENLSIDGNAPTLKGTSDAYQDLIVRRNGRSYFLN